MTLSDLTSPRTSPNVDVRPLGTDASVLITADGRLFEIDKPPAELLRALDDLAAGHDRPVWPELAALLRATGSLDPPPVASIDDVVVLADATLHRAAAALTRSTEHVRPLPDDPDRLRAELARTAAAPLVVLRDRFDPELLLAVDEVRADRQAPWTQLHLDRAGAFLGPAIEPGRTPGYRELLARRRCAVQRPEIAEALLAPPVAGPLRPPPEDVLTWLVALFLADVRRWLAGRPCALLGNEVEIDPAAPSMTVHPLLPLPDQELLAPRNHRVRGTDLLRDKRLGVITATWHVTHHPSIPKALATVQAEVADLARIYPWAPNTVCGGSVFGDPAAAEAAAIGESVERYCGNWVRPERLRLASYEQLAAAGEEAVDPASLVLYSEAQYAAAGFPFVPFTPDLPVHWVAGRSLTHDRPVWVPASVVYVNWYVGPFADAPPTNYPFYAGIAAGATFDDAVRSGLEEIVERDATMIWWANRQRLPVVDPPPRLAALFDGEPAAHGQRAWLLSLPNAFGIPVMAGVVENTVERTVAIGFAARDDPEEAALKAWAEALTLQEISRDLQEPDGLFWQAVRRGAKRQGFIKPWRADRRYLDDFRRDFHDVGDLECQMQVHLDPRAVDTVRPWIASDERRPLGDVPRLPDRSLATYRRLIETAGHEIVAVDVTTPDVAAAGLRVVRTVVPGLVSNFPAAFPFNGHRRLQDEPVRLGWRDRPLPEDDLNLFPLPHA
ncbi:hypothetical protein E1262_29405 [Jiangella aurantiaca]|uniref:YcaO domain-containing protein n=1 Tax=Jiangella aurantiaca TaxID=2530373 RepID=A0A4R4ZYB5_9ACTN|nr:YcaO-like family protein [Jiangella aurantiaca]TDD64025.1 hypothetical protein E1262_29405 [Jiangella aurantiaca]